MLKNNGIEYNKWICFFLSLCFGSLAFVLSRNSNSEVVIDIISFVFSVVFSFMLLMKNEWIKQLERANVWIISVSIILAFLSIDIIRQRFFLEEVAVIKKLVGCPDPVCRGIVYSLLIFSTIGLFVYYLYLGNYIVKNIIKEVLGKMTKMEFIFFCTFIVIMTLITLNTHMTNSAFDYGKYINENGDLITAKFDTIMDCDSNAVQWSMGYFHFVFRHPMFSVAVLPIYAVARAMAVLFHLPNQGIMVIISIINVLMMAICGICLSRLSKSKILMLFFYSSFPVVLYSIVIERHVYMTFWNVIMIYTAILYSQKDSSIEQLDYMPVFQAGASNLTGVIIAIPSLSVAEKSIKSIFNRCILLAGLFVATIIMTGNLGSITKLSEQISENMSNVGEATIGVRFTKYTHALESCFGGITISNPSNYTTYYDESGISLIGIIIALILVVAGIKLWKSSKYARICSFWMLFSFILFPVIGFSSTDFSMHMILFSWAAISLVVMLGERLYQEAKNKWIRYGIVTVSVFFLLWQLTTNITTLTELLSYATRFNFVS